MRGVQVRSEMVINIRDGKIKPRYRIEQWAIEEFKRKRAAVPVQPVPPLVRPTPFKRVALRPRVE